LTEYLVSPYFFAHHYGSDVSDESGAGEIDLLAMQSALAREPQPTYQGLLAGSPVLQVDGIGVIVSSRESVERVLRNPDLFSSDFSSGGLANLKNRRPLIPLQIDPPDHRKYRKILDPLFSPPRMKPLEPKIAGLINELIDGFAGADEIDFAQQFSVPFPSQVFVTMLGLPIEQLPEFLAMKDGIIRPDHCTGEPRGHPKTEAHQQATADAIYAYFEDLLAARGDVSGENLIGQFLAAEVDGDRLSPDEIVDICFTFLIAGLDTISATLDCFFGYLSRNPAARRDIVEHPEKIPDAIEELLRWETPVMAVERVATSDGELGGCPVTAGESVIAFIGAANLDASEQPDAGAVRLDRTANRHLAFGGGIHRCLGSHLARLELSVALREWHRRIPEYSLKPGAELEYTAGIRSVASFPMLLGATAS
jgi:cytochrome P450